MREQESLLKERSEAVSKHQLPSSLSFWLRVTEGSVSLEENEEDQVGWGPGQHGPVPDGQTDTKKARSHTGISSDAVHRTRIFTTLHHHTQLQSRTADFSVAHPCCVSLSGVKAVSEAWLQDSIFGFSSFQVCKLYTE